ncbi:Serine protease nudel [Sergentomyia squamirostris]
MESARKMEKGTCEESQEESLKALTDRTERTLSQILLLSISLCVIICAGVILVIVLFPGRNSSEVVVKNQRCHLLTSLQKSVEEIMSLFKNQWKSPGDLVAQESNPPHEACLVVVEPKKEEHRKKRRDVNAFVEMKRRREKEKIHKRRADARYRTIRDEYLRCKKESKEGATCEKIYEKLLDIVRDIDDKYVTMNKWMQQVHEKKEENVAKSTNINVYSYATKIDVKNMMNPNQTSHDGDSSASSSESTQPPVVEPVESTETVAIVKPNEEEGEVKQEAEDMKDPILERFSAFSSKVNVPSVKIHEDLGNPFNRESFMRKLIPSLSHEQGKHVSATEEEIAVNEVDFRSYDREVKAWRKSMEFDQAASGPFFALCEDYMKQKTPAHQPVIPLKPDGNRPQNVPIAPTFNPFWPALPTSNAHHQSVNVPVTGEASKATSQVIINPASTTGMQAICFIPQTGHQTQMQSSSMWGAPSSINYGQYYIKPRTTTQENDGKSADIVGNGFSSNNQPIYCSFMPSMAVPSVFLMNKSFQRSLGDSESPRVDRLYATVPSALGATNGTQGDEETMYCDEDGTISCRTGGQCIPTERWCDSEVDCMDASDELMCSCKERLNPKYVCDGYLDCPFGEDEMGCFRCEKNSFSCFDTPEDFEKHDGKTSDFLCFTTKDRCDGIDNCLTGKDERDCGILAQDFQSHSDFFSSNIKGILFINHEGAWYPVCGESIHWAENACPSIDERSAQKFRTSFIDINLPGPFVNEKRSFDISDDSFVPFCSGKILNVECEKMKCGMKFSAKPNKDDVVGSTRVVGGLQAESLDWPFIVAIYKNGIFVCGGTIFTNHWIITAAHCADRYHRHYFEVSAGMLRKNSYSPITQITKISHVIPHHGYSREGMQNDIALLRTEVPLRFNKYVRPICLPADGRTANGDDWRLQGPKPGSLCTALGWGAIREKGPAADQLQEVQIPILSECKDDVDNEGNSLCAGEKSGGRDACQGDSGGPLLCPSMNNSDEWYLAGVVSHGEGCARPNEPGVYTRVALYLEWIHQHVNASTLPAQQPKQQCPGFMCVWGGMRCIPRSYHCDQQIDCLVSAFNSFFSYIFPRVVKGVTRDFFSQK